MQLKPYLFAISPVFMVACGDGTNPFDPDTLSVQSSFVTPGTDGTFSSTLDNVRGKRDIDASGNGYAYQVGTIDSSLTLTANAGTVSASTLSTPPTTGTTTLRGTYSAETYLNARVESGAITGDRLSHAGTLQLTADFANNTLTGSDADLTVNGTISSGTLSGTVTFSGITGDLSGNMGATQAIGAFHGTTTDGVMAGGFNVSQ
jgi:hypothetical protein